MKKPGGRVAEIAIAIPPPKRYIQGTRGNGASQEKQEQAMLYEHPTLNEAFEEGFNFARGLAKLNVPKIGETYYTDAFGKVLVTRENVKEIHFVLAQEAEAHARCYSPFEFLAKELNDLGEGGFFIITDGEEPIGPFDTEEEARQEAESLGLEEYEIEDRPSSEDAWEAFEAGVNAMIEQEVSQYFGPEDYEDASEDEDSEDDESEA